MKNFIYCFYNKLSRRYGDVMCYPSDEYASAQIARIASNPQSNLDFVNELELCKVASIDIDSGAITPVAPVRVEVKSPKHIEEVASEA
ncbi:nonstructural protein [Capybara microvirus Cap1_SP_95]|nr:nonstructural protein [Capybara microvirus Cap1_SP_95]